MQHHKALQVSLVLPKQLRWFFEISGTDSRALPTDPFKALRRAFAKESGKQSLDQKHISSFCLAKAASARSRVCQRFDTCILYEWRMPLQMVVNEVTRKLEGGRLSSGYVSQTCRVMAT
eukprot:5437611-Amphidinium_carterae.1